MTPDPSLPSQFSIDKSQSVLNVWSLSSNIFWVLHVPVPIHALIPISIFAINSLLVDSWCLRLVYWLVTLLLLVDSPPNWWNKGLKMRVNALYIPIFHAWTRHVSLLNHVESPGSLFSMAKSTILRGHITIFPWLNPPFLFHFFVLFAGTTCWRAGPAHCPSTWGRRGEE